MAALRIIFMGTPDLAAASLLALLRESAFQIIAVVTQPDRPKGRDLKLQPSPVKQLAVEAGIPVLQPEKARDEKFIERIKAQNQLLSLCLLNQEVRDHLEYLTTDMLPEDAAKTLLEYLQKHPDFVFKRDASNAPAQTSDYCKILLLLYEQLYQDLESLELRYEATRMQIRLIDQYVKTKKAALAISLREADAEQMQTLLQEAKALDALLKQFKE